MGSHDQGTRPRQADLFGSGEPRVGPLAGRLRRIPLSRGAWLDHLPAWLEGHEVVLEALWRAMAWQLQRRQMYDRVVDVPRLVAGIPDDGPGHPVLLDAARALTEHYGRRLPDISLAAYRDGRDSVAFHGDRLGRQVADAIVAIVSLGGTRRFLLRPAGGGPSLAVDLAGGDLLVMGGTCQRTWQHAVPKVAHADLRISAQFRPGTSAGEDGVEGGAVRGR